MEDARGERRELAVLDELAEVEHALSARLWQHVHDVEQAVEDGLLVLVAALVAQAVGEEAHDCAVLGGHAQRQLVHGADDQGFGLVRASLLQGQQQRQQQGTGRMHACRRRPCPPLACMKAPMVFMRRSTDASPAVLSTVATAMVAMERLGSDTSASRSSCEGKEGERVALLLPLLLPPPLPHVALGHDHGVHGGELEQRAHGSEAQRGLQQGRRQQYMAWPSSPLPSLTLPGLTLGDARNMCSMVMAGPRSRPVTLGSDTAARAASSTTISDLWRMPARGRAGQESGGAREAETDR